MEILSRQEIHESALVSENRLFNINVIQILLFIALFFFGFIVPSVIPIKNERNLEAEDEGERLFFFFFFSLISVV